MATLFASALIASALTVDGNLPAGNVVVEKIEGDTVSLHQDLRDTDQNWIYWKFRVMGAAGRTLHFKFTRSQAVGSRSAAVSTDCGKTWTWGDDLQPTKRREPKTNDHPDSRAFSWTFGPKDDEVWFCQTIPYDAADWRAFLDRHAADRGRLFEGGVLCKSRKGRDVEYARFGRLDGQAPHRIFVSSRHHCAETTATFVLEGLLEQVFAQDDLGAWLRENVEFRVVPFADKDGVVDGDQGKMRKPHDHARDYSDTRPVLYPEVGAIMAMLREWNPTVVNDFHCPWLRSSWFVPNSANEFIYQVGIGAPGFWLKQQDFGRTVERLQEAGLEYRQADDFKPGQGWNSAANWTQGMPLIHWAAGVFPDAALITTFEIPFANQRFKTLYPAEFRAFGRDVALAYRAYLKEPECIDGIYPHLAMSNDEFGTGAVVIDVVGAEYEQSVRPGGVGGSPFWNAYAKQFTYAPAFDFKPVAGACRYRFRVTDDAGQAQTFEADRPTASLAPVWRKLAVGQTNAECIGLDADGKPCGTAGRRSFYRAAPFRPGTYPPASCSYAESARKALDWLARSHLIRHWQTGEIDKTFQLNCFPSKMVPTAIKVMVRQAELFPSAVDESLRIAEGAADWMIRNSVKEPASMRGLPITYCDFYEETKALGDPWNSKKIAHDRRNQVMMIYPASVAEAYLKLWKATGKNVYFDAARTIADRYLDLQREDGSWSLVMEFPSGRALVPNAAGATGICAFLDRMSAETGDARYSRAAERALPSILRPLATFDWEGQFEDVAAQKAPYSNLSKHIAADTMMYLLDHDPDGRYRKVARDVLRFAEDQFVCWSQPAVKSWSTPGVIEQYVCAVTINSSYAKMIRFYLKMYEKDRNPLDLAKARALGDALTRAQLSDGLIPTVIPRDPGRAGREWLNCVMATVEALEDLADVEAVEKESTSQVVDGIYPHLAMSNDEGECGTGAVVPWAGSLWVVTYGPHCPMGSSDKLYQISPNLKQIVRPESVGGTPADRLIHRETNQLLIGPYVIDAKGNVRVVPPSKMPGRLTGAGRHLVDPANKVYVATMDNGLYALDMHTLAVQTLQRDHNGVDGKIWGAPRRKDFPVLPDWDAAVDNVLPGSHTKGMCTGFGRIQLSNNGEYHPEAKTNPWIPAGVLGDCAPDGTDQRVIRRCQFTDITTADGIYGNEHPDKNPVWALGWDAKSVILAVTTNGSAWAYYRLPKGSHCYDGAHGWNTEWPRIREAGLGGGDLLATMHGTFWKFPKDFSPAQPNGIRPISTYLKVIGDFCWWKDAPNGGSIVFGCDDHARSEFLGKRKLKGDQPKNARSTSNLWFVKPSDLATFGPPTGEGWVWHGEDVKAGDLSDPYLWAGYGEREFSFVDAAGKSVPHELVHEGDWVRVKALAGAKGATAHFVYGPPRTSAPTKLDAKQPFIDITDDNGKTFRFPNVNGDTNVICREVATERDLLYVGGVFYELPAENAGGFACLRPIALADAPVKSIAVDSGLIVVNGRRMVLDSLWKNGTAAQAYWLWRKYFSEMPGAN